MPCTRHRQSVGQVHDAICTVSALDSVVKTRIVVARVVHLYGACYVDHV